MHMSLCSKSTVLASSNHVVGTTFKVIFIYFGEPDTDKSMVEVLIVKIENQEKRH